MMIEFKIEIAFWFCPLAMANATPSSSIWDFWSQEFLRSLSLLTYELEFFKHQMPLESKFKLNIG